MTEPTTSENNEMIQVEGGTFQIGSTTGWGDEMPVHAVTIGSFKMDKYEITYEKWTEVYNWGRAHDYTDLVAGQNGVDPSGVNNPVTKVNWYDAVKWANARSKKIGLTPIYYTNSTHTTVYRTGQINLASGAVNWLANGYRLPTEAEWEFAARGGNKSLGYIFSGSNNLDSVGWYRSSATHTVGTKTSNELGIYDMSGNLYEWCWDWYGPYSSDAQTNQKGATSGTERILRGGAFYGNADGCPVFCRYITEPDFRGEYAGFRCVKD